MTVPDADRFPDPLPVEESLGFELAGGAVVVDLGDGAGESEAPIQDHPGDLCPTGLALRVPVTEHRTGTVNGWRFDQTWTGLVLVATAASPEGISLRQLPGLDVQDQTATVDAELRPAPDACQGQERIWVSASHSPWAGSWAEVRDRGGISGECPDGVPKHGPDAWVWVRWGDAPNGW